MNVLFFLTPKSEVAVVYNDYSVRQGIEKIKHYGYSAIPMISREGKYLGVITEGDFLRFLTDNQEKEPKYIEHKKLEEINRKAVCKAVSANADIEELMDKVINQNFVPVVDDNAVFIGIVTRKDIIQYLNRKLSEKNRKTI